MIIPQSRFIVLSSLAKRRQLSVVIETHSTWGLFNQCYTPLPLPDQLPECAIFVPVGGQLLLSLQQKKGIHKDAPPRDQFSHSISQPLRHRRPLAVERRRMISPEDGVQAAHERRHEAHPSPCRARYGPTTYPKARHR